MQLQLHELSQLLGAYLHQDWPDEFDSDAAALNEAIKSEPREVVASAVNQIDGLLDQSLSDAALKTIMTQQVGCYFHPGDDEGAYHKWLKKVREILAESL
jgi:hypothetical protein